MAPDAAFNVLAPSFQVLLDGSPAPLELAANVIGIRVAEDLTRPSRFVLQVGDVGRVWTKSNKFKTGKEVELKLGYLGKLESVIKAEIHTWEVDLAVEGPARLVIEGYDRLHRFTRGPKTRTYLNQTDADIVRKVAQEHGLSADCDDPGVLHPFVLQNNIPDFDFLLQRAAVVGYQVQVQGKKLLFKKPSVTSGPVLQLAWGESIGRIAHEINTFDQVARVEVHAWDPVNKKLLSGPAKTGDELSKMGGKTVGSKLSKDRFGQQDRFLMSAATSLKEVEALSKAEFNRRAGDFVQIEVRVDGNPKIRAGTIIEITKTGKRLDGPYYVVSADHIFYTDSGYATEFRARRFAMEKGSGAPKDVSPGGPVVGALSAATSAVNAVKNGVDKAREVFAHVKDAVEKAKKTIEDAQKAVHNAVEAVKTAKEAVEKAIAGAKDLATHLLDEAKAQLAAAKSGLGAAKDALLKAAGVVGASPELKQAIDTAFGAAQKAVGIADKGLKLGESLVEAGGKIVEQVKAGWDKLKGGVDAALKGDFKRAFEQFKGAAENARDAIKTAQEGVAKVKEAVAKAETNDVRGAEKSSQQAGQKAQEAAQKGDVATRGAASAGGTASGTPTDAATRGENPLQQVGPAIPAAQNQKPTLEAPKVEGTSQREVAAPTGASATPTVDAKPAAATATAKPAAAAPTADAKPMEAKPTGGTKPAQANAPEAKSAKAPAVEADPSAQGKHGDPAKAADVGGVKADQKSSGSASATPEMAKGGASAEAPKPVAAKALGEVPVKTSAAGAQGVATSKAVVPPASAAQAADRKVREDAGKELSAGAVGGVAVAGAAAGIAVAASSGSAGVNAPEGIADAGATSAAAADAKSSATKGTQRATSAATDAKVSLGNAPDLAHGAKVPGLASTVAGTGGSGMGSAEEARAAVAADAAKQAGGIGTGAVVAAGAVAAGVGIGAAVASASGGEGLLDDAGSLASVGGPETTDRLAKGATDTASGAAKGAGFSSGKAAASEFRESKDAGSAAQKAAESATNGARQGAGKAARKDLAEAVRSAAGDSSDLPIEAPRDGAAVAGGSNVVGDHVREAARNAASAVRSGQSGKGVAQAVAGGQVREVQTDAGQALRDLKNAPANAVGSARGESMDETGMRGLQGEAQQDLRDIRNAPDNAASLARGEVLGGTGVRDIQGDVQQSVRDVRNAPENVASLARGEVVEQSGVRDIQSGATHAVRDIRNAPDNAASLARGEAIDASGVRDLQSEASGVRREVNYAASAPGDTVNQVRADGRAVETRIDRMKDGDIDEMERSARQLARGDANGDGASDLPIESPTGEMAIETSKEDLPIPGGSGAGGDGGEGGA